MRDALCLHLACNSGKKVDSRFSSELVSTSPVPVSLSPDPSLSLSLYSTTTGADVEEEYERSYELEVALASPGSSQRLVLVRAPWRALQPRQSLAQVPLPPSAAAAFP